MLKELFGTLGLNAWSLLKIPMIAFIGPSIKQLDDETCVVNVPLNFRTRNHLGSMYFAAIAAGADLAGGALAMQFIFQSGKNISLIFKDFQAQFLKRPEDDVLFTCTQGAEIKQLVDEAIRTKERVEFPMKITATVPSKFGDEPVGKFILTLSLKEK